MLGRRTVLSLAFAAATALTGAVLLIPAAGAASGPSFTVSVDYDGTGQGTSAGCPITGAGGDNTANDLVVCTNDDIAYNWNYAIPAGTGTQVVFSQTLPAGVTWDASNVRLCAGTTATGYSGSGAITDNGHTLACTITWASAAQSRSGSIPVAAHVDTTVADQTSIASVLTVAVDGGAPQTLPAPPSITVRSRAQVDLRKWLREYYIASNGDLVIKVDVAGVQATNTSGKGIVSLASPITFTDDLTNMPAGTKLLSTNCYDTPDAGDPQVSSTAHGTWTCAQAGPGQPVTVTITGAVTSGAGSPPVSDGVPVVAGAFWLDVPRSSLVTGNNVLADQLKSFDPNDVTGGSNYGAGYEPGGAPRDTCTNPAPNNNCAQVTVPISATTDSFAKTIVPTGQDPALPVDPANNLPLAGPGGRFSDRIDYQAKSDQNNVVVCDFWDPAQQHIDPTSVATYMFSQPVAGVTVQWTTRTFATDSDRAAAGCGKAGDPTTDGPWLSTAPSDASTITGFRVILPQYRTADGTWEIWAAFTDVDATPGAEVTDAAAAVSTQRTSPARTSATYEVSGNILGGGKTAYDPSGQRTASGVAGESLRYRIAPTFGPAFAVPQVLTIVDTLPGCEVAPTLDASSSAAWTMTVLQAADPGPDGVVCTADDVRGAVLQFVSNAAVSPGAAPPIDYHVLIATDVNDGTVAVNSAVISAPDNRQSQKDRTFIGYLTLRSTAEVRIFKTVDKPTVEVAPDQIGFTLTWSNTEANDVGKTQWIDVLPHTGDGRGSAFSGSLALASTDLHGATSGVTLEYTDATPSSVAPDPSDASNQPSGGTKWCPQSSFGSAGCPSSIGDVTAIRITINDLHSGDTGSLHLVEQPTGNVEGDTYANDVGPGRAAALQLAVPKSNVVRVDVVASSIGRRVWLDANRNGVQDAGETGLTGVTLDYTGTVGTQSVSGSVVTGADGVYTLPNLHSGTYRVVVDAATLPAGLVPTYDLDNGTVNPDGNSGDVALAVNTDRTDVNFGYAPAPPPPSSSSTPPPSTTAPPTTSTPPPSSTSVGSTPPSSSSSTPPPSPSSSSSTPPPSPSSSSSTPPSSSSSTSTSATAMPTNTASSSSAAVEASALANASSSSSGGGLAHTGSDEGALLALAAGLTACGALLLVLARRRNRHG